MDSVELTIKEDKTQITPAGARTSKRPLKWNNLNFQQKKIHYRGRQRRCRCVNNVEAMQCCHSDLECVVFTSLYSSLRGKSSTFSLRFNCSARSSQSIIQTVQSSSLSHCASPIHSERFQIEAPPSHLGLTVKNQPEAVTQVTKR